MPTERTRLLTASPSSSPPSPIQAQAQADDYQYGYNNYGIESSTSTASSSPTIGAGSPLVLPKAISASIGLAKAKDYDRFTSREKRFIVAICAWCGLMPLFVSGTFYPSIPSVAKDFGTTPGVVGIAISISVFAAALGGLTAAAFSGAYGRRLTWLCGLTLLFFGSVGVATAQSIGTLLFWRFFQAYGASPGMSVGAGVIGDIYRLEERGTAMGVFLSASLVGAAIGPPIGGFVANYSSWRFMQGSLGIAGLLGFAIVYAFFPETLPPEHRIGAANISDLDEDEPYGRRKSTFENVITSIGTIIRNVNPFRPLWMLKSPLVFFISVAGFTILLTDFVLLVPLAYTIAAKYHIHTAAGIGACYLPIGFGNMIGAPIGGRMSDYIVARCRQNRGGVWYPEDRLRITVFGAVTMVPLSTLGSGLATHYVGGMVGLVANFVCLFVNGVGVTITLSTISSYMVDVLHERSAESVAAIGAFRAAAVAMTVSGIIPMVETYGVAITDGAAAAFAWLGGLLLWITVRYGNQLRSLVDIGYSKSMDGQ